MKGSKLTALLVVAGAAVGIQNYVFFSRSSDASRPIYEAEEDELFESDVAVVPLSGEIDAEALTAWLSSQNQPERNPFVTEAEARERQEILPVLDTDPALQLAATLWSPERRVAWINGRPRSEGDWVGQSQIAKINSESVVLMRDGKRIPLRIRPSGTSASRVEQGSHAN